MVHPLLFGLGGWPELRVPSCRLSSASGWWWRYDAAGTGSLGRGSLHTGTSGDVGLGQGYSTACDLVRAGQE